jgi:alpha-L-fucosidase
MRLTRRRALKLIANTIPALAMRRILAQQATDKNLGILVGPFAATRTSLKTYTIPAWFPDAKFGIWAHWGPQSAIGDGDWYARNMYIQGSPQYEYHRKRFGHPSKFGYKDAIPLFTAERWDPDHLMDLYVKAGAKYFFSMGVHHDNFDMWNSKYHPHWNAVDMGPKKDIVGLWAQAARKRGLRFGVSEHLSNSFDWFATSHASDTTGDMAGIPYDGADPRFFSLYHDYTDEPADFIKKARPMGLVAPDAWKREYFSRIKDLVDQYHPDLLYTDGGIPFDEYGLSLVAEEYDVSAKEHAGEVESVYNSKTMEDCTVGTCVLDRERGVLDDIWPNPWQTDTCIGDWHYKEGYDYKSPKKIIDLLVDIVSKNGNLLLNFPLPASGELDAREQQILQTITDWMSVNGDAIHATRPWKIYGEGPSTKVLVGQEKFNEKLKPDLTTQDIRFTTKGKALYAFIMGWPGKEALIPSLASTSAQAPGMIANVRMLGYGDNLKFVQDPTGLRISLPDSQPAMADLSITLEVRTA